MATNAYVIGISWLMNNLCRTLDSVKSSNINTAISNNFENTQYFGCPAHSIYVLILTFSRYLLFATLFDHFHFKNIIDYKVVEFLTGGIMQVSLFSVISRHCNSLSSSYQPNIFWTFENVCRTISSLRRF